LLVAEQQQGRPAREREPLDKVERVVVREAEAKIYNATRNWLHKKMGNEKAFKNKN
jgi:hypothetical protein